MVSAVRDKGASKGVKRYFIKKSVSGLLAMLLLFGYAAWNMRVSFPTVGEELSTTAPEQALRTPETIDSVLKSSLLFRDPITDVYGIVQERLLAEEIDNFMVVADDADFLHSIDLSRSIPETSGYAQRVADLATQLEEQQIPLTYIVTPDDYFPGVTILPEGVPEPLANHAADEMLAALRERNIETLDLRARLSESGLSAEELFYRTDPTWTNKAAFWAYTLIVEDMEKHSDFMLTDSERRLLDPEAYVINEAFGAYAGRFTQVVGTYYVPLDDYTWIYPVESNTLAYTATDGITNISKSGSFAEVLLPSGGASRSYGLIRGAQVGYLSEDEPVHYITNKDLETGPRVLIIGDEMNKPVTAYLSSVCSLVMLVDPAAYRGDIVRIATELEFDYVYVSLSPNAIDEEHFPWYRQYRVD